jgi:ABC-2 type transport system permease protein
MTDLAVPTNASKGGSTDRREQILPAPGNPFQVALADLAEALRLSPVWLHEGWINVVWRFRRTKLGPFWHTLGLGGFVLTMGVIWSAVLNVDPFEYFRYVTVNLIVWSLISSFINEGTVSLVGGQATALSMRFPFAAFSLAQVWRAILLFAHHFVLYLVVIAATMYPVGWSVFLAVPALFLVIANGVWLSMVFGILGLRWRDIGPATATAMQIMMFVTPVFWPKDLLGPQLAFVVDYNPLYYFVLIVREPLLGAAPPLESWLWVGGTFVVGSTLAMWLYGQYRNRMPYWY